MLRPFFPLSQPAARSSTGTYCSTADCLCAAATWSNWENHSSQITVEKIYRCSSQKRSIFWRSVATAAEHAGVINILCLYEFSSTVL